MLPDTEYKYTVFIKKEEVAKGRFKTAPLADKKDLFRVTFGSCFHKIGVHNPNLIHQILERNPQAMLLLGDLAVDDRKNKASMHRADYLLRDLSMPWQQLAANVPLYAS